MAHGSFARFFNSANARPARRPSLVAVESSSLAWSARPASNAVNQRRKLRCFSQLIFAHDTFVRLVAASDLIFKLAIMIRQSSGDDIGDIGAARDIVAKGGT